MSKPIPFDPAAIPAGLLAALPIAGRLDVAPTDSPYPLPNIPEEDVRLSLQHFIMRAFLRGNSITPQGRAALAPDARGRGGNWTNHILGQAMQQAVTTPINPPQRILDVGCGNGRWAVELARQFPQAAVTGVDI